MNEVAANQTVTSADRHSLWKRTEGAWQGELAQQGSPIGPLDLQIASIAALNGLILVTSNTREFTRISGLQVEDWSV